MKDTTQYKSLSRLVLLAAGLFVAIWFTYQVISVILFVFFAIVIMIVLNAPVTWLQRRKVSRTIATLLVFFGLLLLLGLLGWMVVPKIVTQVELLLTNLPQYLDSLNHRVNEWMGGLGIAGEKTTSSPTTITDQLTPLIGQLGRYSITFFQNIILVILFFCLVFYMLVNPKPLLEIYLSYFPADKKEKASEAFANASVMTIGWMWSNILSGALRATIVWFFLYFMGIPGMWVFALVTFFAELIPRIGFYIATVPPILIALSISPVTALWSTVFFLVLDEVISDFVTPRIRSHTMKIHPVFTIIVFLAMTAAFGVMGALIATPLAAFIKAYHEAFYKKKQVDENDNRYIDKMLFRK